jgi:hypothetical protein
MAGAKAPGTIREEKIMRVVDKRTKVSRRGFLRGSGGLVALSVGAGFIAAPDGAWALGVKNLKPDTMQTLVQMARDIYPHDQLGDRFYVAAVAPYDEKAGTDASVKALIEDGIAGLDSAAKAKHKTAYTAVAWEADRVALLRQIQDGKFFQTIRGGLVTGLYNNPEVWTKFGYEGSSADKGGYIERGFNDINWL